ncbi:hypothetical protein IWX65_001716 [Arthrobacter sp. CAN_A214]
MELGDQELRLHGAPEGAVERFPLDCRFHTRRIRVQPSAPTGKPAVFIDHDSEIAVDFLGHHPHQM